MISEKIWTPHTIIVLFVIWCIGRSRNYLDWLHTPLEYSIIFLSSITCTPQWQSWGTGLLYFSYLKVAILSVAKKVHSRVVWHNVWSYLWYLQQWQLYGCYNYLEIEHCNTLSHKVSELPEPILKTHRYLAEASC